MEQSSWSRRKRAPAAKARSATSAAAPEDPDWVHYGRLESGARWLAAGAATEAERTEHLGAADRYARLQLEAPGEGKR